MKTFEELMQEQTPKLLNCVHCGLCLDECPTYQISGDENNSPRGRLAHWRAIAEGRIEAGASTDHYTGECVGCLACVSACPANVPYGDLLIETRAERAKKGAPLDWRLKLGAALASRPALFSALALPLRLSRRLGLRLHRALFPGKPATLLGTAAYARAVMRVMRPTGPKVALLQGCLMDAVFRELNFASIRVLAANGYQVAVPEAQTCCGAMHAHAGLPGKAALDAQNAEAFEGLDCIVSNASGCGLSLSHSFPGRQRDIIDLLENGELRQGATLAHSHVYYDFPCHAYHGLGLRQPPAKIFKSLGVPWSLAPDADRCCGSGGAYQFTHAKNASEILVEKSAFLNDSPHDNPLLVTANHVCMMQWSQAKCAKPFQVRHLVQLLDESYEKAGLYQGIQI
jgi:glycolate oxidase iron-sulfur subunit